MAMPEMREGAHAGPQAAPAMNSKLLWLIVAVAIILGYVLYLSLASRDRLEIDPHARQEIEKAKHR
jgi:hypothetical protein